MAHAASQLKKNRDFDVNAVEDEKEKKRKIRKRSREQKKKRDFTRLNSGTVDCGDGARLGSAFTSGTSPWRRPRLEVCASQAKLFGGAAGSGRPRAGFPDSRVFYTAACAAIAIAKPPKYNAIAARFGRPAIPDPQRSPEGERPHPALRLTPPPILRDAEPDPDRYPPHCTPALVGMPYGPGARDRPNPFVSADGGGSLRIECPAHYRQGWKIHTPVWRVRRAPPPMQTKH
ncbi:hypothetical protein SKAU_G00181300 [Synaphobranchus kaupii]|uniref:Uncharacterized protein n=1 Tax=Synaphobranchus kaupii TaxID=118154 RepID=A0A9Q1J1P5_SYNKA|nr:hypothetical protein SKAU_G00181300 [Synaphobranchus kaupii]